MKEVDAAKVPTAISTFRGFLNNRKLAAGSTRDDFVHIGIEVIPRAALEAWRKAEDKRIIPLGG